MNRLAHEDSPYLQQHKHYPFDWYPWGNEAFEKAKNEDKPIFLSIGYSSCHWCHVMEEEDFEDEAIAKLVNEGFFQDGGRIRGIPVTIGGCHYIPPIPLENIVKEEIEIIVKEV